MSSGVREDSHCWHISWINQMWPGSDPVPPCWVMLEGSELMVQRSSPERGTRTWEIFALPIIGEHKLKTALRCCIIPRTPATMRMNGNICGWRGHRAEMPWWLVAVPPGTIWSCPSKRCTLWHGDSQCGLCLQKKKTLFDKDRSAIRSYSLIIIQEQKGYVFLGYVAK